MLPLLGKIKNPRMKKSKLISITAQFVFLITAGFYFSGCSDSVTSTGGTIPANKHQARSEGEFNLNAGLKAFPGAVLVVDLEDLNSPVGNVGNDTGPIGEDVIPYTYSETAIHRIRLGEEVHFKARLVSESGEVIYQLNNPDDSVRVTIPAGNYKLYLTSRVNYGSDTLGRQAVFIQPDLEAIASGGGVGSQGGFDQADFNTLMKTRKCIKCDFMGINLQGYNLAYVDISYSDFSLSNIAFINFSHATLNHVKFYPNYSTTVDFSNATFNHTDLSKSNFYDVDFSHATFDSSDISEMNNRDLKFIGTKFTNCYLKNTSFRNINYSGYQFIGAEFRDCDCQGVDFYKANLTNAIFSDVDIRYAGMCDQNRTGALFSEIKYNNRTECWP